MKKLFVWLLMAMLLTAVGCVTKTVTYTKTTQTDGTVIEQTVTESDGSLLTEKTVAAAGSVQAAKVETTGSTSSGTLLPNFIIGGGNSAIMTSPKDDDRPVMAYSKSTSLLGSLASVSASGISFVYKGISGETAEQTEKRVAALKTLSGDENTEAAKEPATD